ncbi:hypothetical protein M569_03850, partial [Genlisea aurea]
VVSRSSRGSNGLIPHSFKALSRIVSSGASTVASTVRSAASAIVERDAEANNDQVTWAGFDKLELERGVERQVLLLGFNHGFQVWDAEIADNVRNLASRHDGLVSFMQMQPKPLTSALSEDKFAHVRPLLIICADGTTSSDDKRSQCGALIPRNGSPQQYNGSISMPTAVWFYSLKSQSYVHVLRFRSAVHLVRCSSRVVCVMQSDQVHCLNPASLEKEYSVITNPVTPGYNGYGNIGVGPLALGPRWMAYSGNLVATSDSGRVTPQHLTPSCSSPAAAANGSLVAHYAKESSKQLAAGIVSLGDLGYKKLSRYYSDLLPDGKNGQSGNAASKMQSVFNGYPTDVESIGVVIVRDIVNKTMLAQFRAHKSPISSLCFDPSGTLLVTASVQGHNINVFRISPGDSSSGHSYAHLYRLQRGFTNALIQDISFSIDSQWIMVSSSRGTSHLFAISPFGGTSGMPITLSPVSRIRNGSSSNGWKNTVTSVAATGRFGSSFSGAIASAFHKCKGGSDMESWKKNYYLLVFSPAGCMIQYALRFLSAFDGNSPTSPAMSIAGCDSSTSNCCDVRLMVEAIQKWNICQKQNRKDLCNNNMDVYGENGVSDCNKVYPESMKCESFGEKMTDEKYHMYISEAELQMHQNTNPLWLRSEIYYQLMLADPFDVEEASVGGEIEVEKLPIHKLEARSKDLIPVYNYVQTPLFQQ